MCAKDVIIFLVGPRASGKSTVGAHLARLMGLRFDDTDQKVQALAGFSVADMVAAHGWPYFRAKESEALRLAAVPGSVVATGGGAVLAPENRLFMRQTGLIFYLHAEPALLVQRLSRQPLQSQRPSLTGQNLLREVEDVLRERLPLYRESAHYSLDAFLPPETLATTMAHLLARSLQ